MKHPAAALNAFARPLCRMLAVAALLGVLPARADEFADVLQLLRNGRSDDALARIDAYLVAKPRDPQMRFVRGVVLNEKGRTAEASAAFLALTQEFPELPEPHNNLAVLYARQGEYDKARAALEMAVRANPGYAVAHENLGDIYASLANQAYARALQLDPGNATLAPKIAATRAVATHTSTRNSAAPVWPTPAASGAAPAPRR